MSDPIRSLKRIFDKIKKTTLTESISPTAMKALGDFAVDTVVKRTRLGYGVSIGFGVKSPLKALSNRYKQYRKNFPKLSSTTTPSRSNLTLTGQMLASVRVINIRPGVVRFGPTGYRTDSNLSNLQVAAYQEGQGRVFNRISQLEYQQILRFYRREFGDLLKKRDLIR